MSSHVAAMRAAAFALLVACTSSVGTGCVVTGAGTGATLGGGKRDPLDAYVGSADAKHAAPAEPPLLQPWQIGQWAAYQRTTKQGVSVLVLRIVAEDECGVWIERELDDGERREVTRACVVHTRTADGTETVDRVRAVMVRVDGELETVGDLDDDELASGDGAALRALLEARWSGKRGLAREEVATPAGTFLAVRDTIGDKGTTTERWSHPAVPITGIVKHVIGDEVLELLETGTATHKPAVLTDNRELSQHVRWRQRLEGRKTKWLAMTFGTELYGDIDDATTSSSLGVLVGYYVRPTVSLVFGSWQTSPSDAPIAAPLAEALSLTTLGVRWYPFERPTPIYGRLAFDTRSVYVQLDVGYAELDRERNPTTPGLSTVARGGGAGLRLGINVQTAQDWRMALEVHEHTALLNSDERTRIVAGIGAIIELFFP